MIVWLFAILTFASTLAGGYFAIKFSDKLHLILGFSAGAVMGVALFDLIPESYNLAVPHYSAATVAALMAVGFIFYMVFDRYFSIHCEPGHNCENPRHNAKLGATTLVLHSFIDGVAIGLSFQVSAAVGVVVAVAVLAHDFSDGINTVNAILRNESDNKKARTWLLADAIAPALGVGAAFLVPVSEPILGLLIATFAGLFLYLGASDLVPESHHKHPTFWTTAMTILGMAIIYLAIRLAS